MKFKKEKMELLSGCWNWDVEGLQEIKDMVVELKLASKAGKSKQWHGSQVRAFPRKGMIWRLPSSLGSLFTTRPSLLQPQVLSSFSQIHPPLCFLRHLFLLARLNAALVFTWLASNPSPVSPSVNLIDNRIFFSLLSWELNGSYIKLNTKLSM